MRLLVHGKPDPSGFNQRNKNSNAEVEILGGGVTGRGWKLNAAAAEISVECALFLHHHAGQWAVENGNRNAKQQSGYFYEHVLSLSMPPCCDNQ